MINEEMKVPKGWQIVKLKEITDSIQYGYTESSSKDKVGPKFLRITDIQDNKVQWDDVPYCKIDNEIKGKYLLKDGDLVFARTGATVGKSFLIKGDIPDAVFASYLIRVRVNREINEKYLSCFFHSYNYWSQITEGQVGIGQPNVNGTKLGQLNIPLPPLPEQTAIVAKIEELLSDLENGKQQLQTAQQQLIIYRQSLLNRIVTGINCRSIESVIDKLDQGWSPKCINEHSSDVNQWTVIKTTAIQQGFFLEDENKILPKDLIPREQHELKSGDILITRAGPRIRVGICCMIKTTRPRLINCDKVYRIKVNHSVIKPEYFELILNTPYYQREIEKMKSGISDSGLNLTQSKFLKIEIPIPSIEEQKKIVDDLEAKLTLCDNISATITQSLAQTETLRQSILKKAFEGKLV